MNANDVYNIAKALPKEEFVKLYDMIRSEIDVSNPRNKKVKHKPTLPDYSVDDSIKYLIENHFNKKRTA